MVGGGMRQSGVLAAAGLVAIHKMSKRLVEDHERAARLAKGLTTVGPAVKILSCDTNFVFIELNLSAATGPTKFSSVAEFIQAMHEKFQVRLVGSYPGVAGSSMRLVTHYYITDAAIAHTIYAFKQLLCPGS